jgi:hypothetical protein
MEREIILVIWESLQTSKLLFSEAISPHNRTHLEGQLVSSHVIGRFYALTTNQSVLCRSSVRPRKPITLLHQPCLVSCGLFVMIIFIHYDNLNTHV